MVEAFDRWGPGVFDLGLQVVVNLQKLTHKASGADPRHH